MIGAIVGDIVGSRFEWDNIKTKHFDLFTDISKMTDDSVMTLAIANAIIMSNNDLSVLDQNAIDSMQTMGRKYKDYGYGGHFYEWINSDAPEPYNSWGNGSAMRVSACAYISKKLDEVLVAADKVTAVTHNHPEGIKGARATVEAIFLAREGKNKDIIRKELEKYYDLNFTLEDIRDDYEFDVSCQGSVPQALVAFLESNDFEDAIRNAISIGGDSDTIAAITGSVAEAFYGVPMWIKNEAIGKMDEYQLEILNTFENKYPGKIIYAEKR